MPLVRKVPSSSSAKLDKLLKDLEALETITQDTLLLVRAEIDRYKAPGDVSSEIAAKTKNVASVNLNTHSRNALKIIKACLNALKPSAIAPAKALTKPSSRNGHVRATNDGRLSLAAEACLYAIEGWSRSIDCSDIKRQLDIILVRSNFVSRLLDHRLLDKCRKQMCCIHRSIHGSAAFHKHIQVSEIQSLLTYCIEDIKPELRSLVISSQLQVMRYLFESDEQIQNNVLAALEAPGGPIDTCRRLQMDQEGSADRHLEYLHKAIFSLSSRVAEDQLSWQVHAIECLCAQHAVDLVATAKLLAKCLPAKCSPRALDKAELLATQFLGHAVIDDRLRLVLSERMANLMRLNEQPDRAHAWTQRTVAAAAEDTSANIAHLLEATILDLNRSKNYENRSRCIRLAEANVKTAQAGPLLVPDNARAILKAINLLRKNLAALLVDEPLLGSDVTALFSAMLSLLQKNKSIVDQQSVTAGVVSGLIDALISCFLLTLDVPGANPALSLAGLLSVADEFALEQSKPRIWTQCWNAGGSLFNKGQVRPAADLLVLAAQWSAVYEDVKKLQFIWTCFLQLNDYPKAVEWLLCALTQVVTEASLEEMDKACQASDYAAICNRFFDASRILQKLASIDVSTGDYSIEGLFEGRNAVAIHELYFYHLWQQSTSTCCSSTILRHVSNHVLSYSDHLSSNFEQHISIALACAFELRDEAWWQNLQSRWSTLKPDDTKGRTAFDTCRVACYTAFRAHDEPSTTNEALLAVRVWLESLSSSKDSGKDQADEAVHLLQRLGTLAIEQEQSNHVIAALSLAAKLQDEYKLRSALTGTSGSELALCNALLYCGLLNEASAALRKASKASNSTTSETVAIIVAQARIAIGDHDLQLAQETLESLKNISFMSMRSSDRSSCAVVVLTALASLAEAQGCTTAAIQFEFEALTILRRQVAKQLKQDGSRTGDLSDELSNAMEGLAIADSFQLNTSRQLSMCMHRLAVLHGQCGFVRDAIYYAQQAFAIAEASDLAVLRFRAQVLLQLLQLRSGQVIGKAIAIPELPGSIEDFATLFRYVELWFMKGDIDAADEALARCSNLVDGIRSLSTSVRRPLSSRAKAAQLKKSSAKTDRFDAPLEFIVSTIAALHRQMSPDMIPAAPLIPSLSLSKIQEAMIQHQTAQTLLEEDPVYGSLHDSALSLPSVCSTNAKLRANGNRKGQTGSQAAKATPAVQEIRAMLQSSKLLLATDYEEVLYRGESYTAHAHGTLFANLNLTHSAIVSLTETTIRPEACNYFLESSRATSLTRELERRQFQPRSAPYADIAELSCISPSHKLPPKDNFAASYIDNIPDHWSVVSIGLGAEKTDLIVSRMQARKTPLIVRLPLARHNARDMDEETFAFESAREELLDIIKTSNESAQAAKNIHGKQAKLDWWALRKGLDERLQVLLSNMERCWLGGFRGLLGRSQHDSSAFDHFKTSFAKIMMTFVPFRSNRSFDIDTRILDLFVDLGSIDHEELLELLEDLLYFILDIYQFHGESIAYDEIDIDRMTVDIQSALNAYHERTMPAAIESHTVLILDKELSMFPWESINCLRGCSVSRVPSLTALKALLDKHGSQPTSSATGGRYVLNPSQDLKQTEDAFRESLQQLNGWQGVISRAPTEAELLEFVTEASIYIYFGHGGGEQYVRASKIKQVPQAALAILMGCSSGSLKDQGLYDCWGTPYNYLVAGAPAVLANLWDVTDKDIDRFSEKVLTHWGLFQQGDQRSPTKGKRRGKLQCQYGKEVCSLALAVAKSRDQCVMPFLNGAAPVVYGLPVHLVK